VVDLFIVVMIIKRRMPVIRRHDSHERHGGVKDNRKEIIYISEEFRK